LGHPAGNRGSLSLSTEDRKLKNLEENRKIPAAEKKSRPEKEKRDEKGNQLTMMKRDQEKNSTEVWP